jgi:hypothetical protein
VIVKVPVVAPAGTVKVAGTVAGVVPVWPGASAIERFTT